MNIFIELGLIVTAAILFWRFLNHPAAILYALALAVSFIAVNVNIGFTIYVSRLLLMVLLIVILLRPLLGLRGGIQFGIDPRFIILFIATIIVQSLTIPIVQNVAGHVRIMFIYLSMMAIFIAVLVLGINANVVIRALRYYLAFGVVQGLVGVYQVIGGMKGWPMYQDFVYGSVADTIRTGNPRNLMGVYWGDDIPRAFGFLSDVNHFGGYTIGVILLALAFLAYNRRDILAYMALIAGGAGLILSQSRSAWLTFLLFGLPVLIYLLRKAGFILNRINRPIKAVIIVVLLFFCAGYFVAQSGLFDIKEVLSRRIESFISSESSAEAHINTRLWALDAWKSSPYIGIGLDFHIDGWHSARYQEVFAGAHSHHINVLAGNGILGLALEWMFMGLVGIKIWHGLKYSGKKSLERIVLAGLLAAYIAVLLGNFLYHYYLYDFVWFLMGCGVALSSAVCPPRMVEKNLYRRDAEFAE